MSKDKKDKGNKKDKELRKLRKEIRDLAGLVGELYDDLATIGAKLETLVIPQGVKVQEGAYRIGEHVYPPGLTFGPFREQPVQRKNYVENPAAQTSMVGWDAEAGKPVPVKRVTPNLDPEASEYTFHFTDEMLERLGLPDMSFHLEEVPGGKGALQIVEGPPTDLLPEHRELVDETLADAESVQDEKEDGQ